MAGLRLRAAQVALILIAPVTLVFVLIGYVMEWWHFSVSNQLISRKREARKKFDAFAGWLKYG